ncbi:endonuclease/exonuclease/phosphatase family protein [Georgenia sp. Z1344]|uniref:endonuclease/exonuclease/phosphatase family protein n=1 Tax=Georgenia sp. Z1344 TaxID=3416706 RepID=UPI003CFB850A
MRRGARVIAVVAAVLVALASLYSLRPLWLSERIPVAQVVALKGVLAAVLVGLGLAIALAAGLVVHARSRRLRVNSADEPGARRRTARMTTAVTVVLVGGVVTALSGVAHGLALADRGTSGGLGPVSDDPPTADSFTVLTLNTLGGASSPSDVVAHAVATGADVLALPETPAELAVRISDGLEQRLGEGFTSYTDGSGPIGSTSLVVADALGPYEQLTGATTGGFGRVHLDPVSDDPDQPALVAAHPIPPVSGNMAAWRQENLAILGTCQRAARPTVIAGDLNMTLDHGTLVGIDDPGGRCHAAGVDAGIGGIATWPTSWPTWAGAAIDHVLVAGGLRGVSGTVDEVGGSDHRAVVVEVRLVTAAETSVPRVPGGEGSDARSR